MAPELYKEKYDEKVDIYAFGMVMLEMVTGDYPYCECENAAQIFMKVINGVKPASLRLIQLQSVKDFIEMCLDNKEKRPSAKELMQHAFLQPSADDDVTFFFAGETIVDPSLEPSSMLTVPHVQLPVATPKSADSDNAPTPKVSAAHIDTPRVVLQGEGPSAEGTVQMKLYLKIRGAYKEIKFPFNLMEDTAADVATEMVSELELADTASYIDLITKGISDVLADQSLKAHKVKKQAIPLEIDPSALPDETEKKPQEKITHEPAKPVDPKVVASPVKQPPTNISPSDHESTKDTPNSPDTKKIPQPVQLVDSEHHPSVVVVPPQQRRELVEIPLPTHTEEKPVTEKPIAEKPASPEVKVEHKPPVQPEQPATKPTIVTVQPAPIQIPPPVVTTPVHTSPTEKEKPVIAQSTTSNLSTEEIEVLYNFMREKQNKEERELREKHKREREEFNKKHGVSISAESVWPMAKQEILVSSPVTVIPVPVQQTTAPQQQAAASVTQQNSTAPTKQPEQQATVKPIEKQPLSVDTNLASKTDVAKPETTPKTSTPINEAKPPLAKPATNNTTTPVAATNNTAPQQNGTMNGTAAKPTTPASTLQAQQMQQKPASVGKPTATVPVPPPLKSNDAIANDLMNDMISKNLGGLDSLLGKTSVASSTTAQQQQPNNSNAQQQTKTPATNPAQQPSIPPKSTSLTSAINPAALLKAANANPSIAQSMAKQAPLLELNEHTAS